MATYGNHYNIRSVLMVMTIAHCRDRIAQLNSINSLCTVQKTIVETVGAVGYVMYFVG